MPLSRYSFAISAAGLNALVVGSSVSSQYTGIDDSMKPPRLMLRRSLPSISPCVRASISFTPGLLIAALHLIGRRHLHRARLHLERRGRELTARSVLVARCSAVHFTQPPSSSATFEWP